MTDSSPQASSVVPVDHGREMMKQLVIYTVARLTTQDHELLTPAFLEFTRKLLNDNAITMAQVRKGDFGEVYQAASEEFEYPYDPTNAQAN